MTLQKLYNLRRLKQEIDYKTSQLETLEQEKRSIPSPNFDGMPKSFSAANNSRVERLACKIIDLQTDIMESKIKLMSERIEVERWIRDIPDSLTRLIFLYRFVDALPTWADVAEVIGDNTADSVKKICYRYLNKKGERS